MEVTISRVREGEKANVSHVTNKCNHSLSLSSVRKVEGKKLHSIVVCFALFSSMEAFKHPTNFFMDFSPCTFLQANTSPQLVKLLGDGCFYRHPLHTEAL